LLEFKRIDNHYGRRSCRCGDEPATFALHTEAETTGQTECLECGNDNEATYTEQAEVLLGRHCLANLIETALEDFEVRRELELRRVLPQGVTA